MSAIKNFISKKNKDDEKLSKMESAEKFKSMMIRNRIKNNPERIT